MSNESRVWKTAAEFKNEEKTFCIRVTQCELPPRFEGQIPLVHYTWELLRLYDDRPVRFFPITCVTKKGEVSVESFDLSEVGDALAAAFKWVKDRRQEREDRVRELKQERD